MQDCYGHGTAGQGCPEMTVWMFVMTTIGVLGHEYPYIHLLLYVCLNLWGSLSHLLWLAMLLPAMLLTCGQRGVLGSLSHVNWLAVLFSDSQQNKLSD
jgi:hypothetical protein